MRASRYFGAPQQRTLGTNLDKLQITIELKSTDKGLYLIQIYTLSSGRYNERPTTKAEYFDKKNTRSPLSGSEYGADNRTCKEQSDGLVSLVRTSHYFGAPHQPHFRR